LFCKINGIATQAKTAANINDIFHICPNFLSFFIAFFFLFDFVFLIQIGVSQQYSANKDKEKTTDKIIF
jgi:hypothetical protein